MMNATATTEEMPARNGKTNGSDPFANGRWVHTIFQPSDFTIPEDPFDDARRILDAAIAILSIASIAHAQTSKNGFLAPLVYAALAAASALEDILHYPTVQWWIRILRISVSDTSRK